MIEGITNENIFNKSKYVLGIANILRCGILLQVVLASIALHMWFIIGFGDVYRRFVDAC